MLRLSKNKLSAALAISLLSGLSASLSAAEERWFEVEVYIFERDVPTTEQWPTDAATPSKRKTVDFITPLISTDLTALNMGLNGCTSTDWATDSISCNEQMTSAKHKAMADVPMQISAPSPAVAHLGDGAVLLAESQSQFKDIIATISREKGTTSLLHMTWQQSMLPRNRAIPVKLFSGHDYSEEFQFNGQPIEANSNSSEFTNFDFFGPQFTDDNQQPVWKFDGTINIYLQHYLFIETDFRLREAGSKTVTLASSDLRANGNTAGDNSQQVTSPFLYSIPMTQNRRVRSDEVHYFDHPKMGMIIQIRKMQHPSAKATEPMPEADTAASAPINY
ncbi:MULTISPECIES: peptidoglycan binding protein CsiV [Shewanella]|uniref:Peptidoglycan binding protein CsiV n=1 Tax=Shewanella fidelis TaxID=173509 RepID=A0AAW8NRE4_9GAMM|nr:MULTISPECIES: peptidoglycan binding protein CsiV [Shewanella]MDR8524298.1 peptidoglycan binding protein CsiV [Shewanella fidelis]MDW4813493.1 peptidoglycan binding protein CsiV [Shewanella fidelis]MDW4817584.1 peptidoglycan binding protein CsiV [Shewanella fidelis]MDW4821651.1 peptidoglycan binding protein CsiV [Shewanella fidelis]MDW4825816.1 peptidoglycan binding protein CsiV [Shewanella fidelis]